MCFQPDSDISEYTYERTLRMEQRNEMLKELRKNIRKDKAMAVSFGLDPKWVKNLGWSSVLCLSLFAISYTITLSNIVYRVFIMTKFLVSSTNMKVKNLQ